jgi:hypothetical protein
MQGCCQAPSNQLNAIKKLFCPRQNRSSELKSISALFFFSKRLSIEIGVENIASPGKPVNVSTL